MSWIIDVLFLVLMAMCAFCIIAGVVDAVKDELSHKKKQPYIIDHVASDAIKGKWGFGEDRKRRLKLAGYDPKIVQQRINEIMAEKSGVRSKGVNVMTCREKLKLEHPDCIDLWCAGGCKGCPGEYGYRDETVSLRRPGCIHDCYVCWDQPVETKTFSGELTDAQKLYMDALKAMSTYAGTKLDDRKSKYAESAQEMFALYSAFKDAGFNDNQAFGLTRTAFANATHNQNKE